MKGIKKGGGTLTLSMLIPNAKLTLRKTGGVKPRFESFNFQFFLNKKKKKKKNC